MDRLAYDLRHASRLLWKSKRITATTLLTLALCIGATTAIFSTVYSLMLKPLPFQEPERIVELYTSAVKAGLDHMPANIPFYLDYSQNASSYESIGLWTFFYGLVGDKESVARVPGVRMTAEIFNILRIQPLIGTFFTKEQNRPGADKVIVLTQSYWQTQYQESPEVLGKEVRIDDEAYKVIGVAPRVLEAFDARMKFVVPLSWPPAAENPQGRYGVGTQLFGRLKPGVTAGQANAEAKILEKRYVDAGPPPLKDFVERSGMTMNVGGVQEQRVQPVRSTLLMLQGGVAFVLLIGCVNVANLLLVRSNARQSELAIRSALGASRATIARQFLLESLLLTSLGAALGLGVAWGSLRVTNFYLAKMLPQSLPASLDWRVLGFAVALTVVVGLLIGLIPVLHILRTNLAAVIQSNSRSASSGRGVRALSGALVVAQVAVALMLLTGAGLLIHSFAEALRVDTGLEARNVVTARLALTREHRASDEAANKIRERLLQALREIPGVTSVALSFSTPFQGGLPINAFTLENDTLPPGSPQPGAFRVIVTPGYLETLGLKLVEGRFYEEADLAPGRRLFVVDQSFARKFFPKGSAVGGKFSFGGRPAKPEDWPVIVGVVKDVPHNGVEEKSGNPIIYQVMQGGRPGGIDAVRADRPAGGRRGLGIAAEGARHRPGDATLRGRQPGAGGRFVVRQPPCRDAAARGVCRSRTVPVGAGHLRRAGVRRLAADARNWRAQRHRRVAGADCRSRPATGVVESRHRRRAGVDRRRGPQQVHDDAALQRPADRSRCVCGGVAGADCRGASRQLSAGAAGRQDRSADCVAERVRILCPPPLVAVRCR